MHLWPTRKLRESWKVSSIGRVEWTINEMQARRRAEEAALRQNLCLETQGKARGPPTFTSLNIVSDESWLYGLFRNFVFALTCCCCFGACMDEIDFYTSF